VTSDEVPKLLDFGIVKILDPAAAADSAEPTISVFRAKFAAPVSSVSVWANAILDESAGPTSNMPYMNAYDVNGNYLGTVEYSASQISQSLGWVQLSLSSSQLNNVPIGMVVFSSSYATNPVSYAVWGEFDNFSFTLTSVTVPSVVGMSVTNAESAITAALLSVGQLALSTNSCSVPADTIVSQNPAAGTEVGQGTAVNLVVAGCMHLSRK
jgi:hypothetical protein